MEGDHVSPTRTAVIKEVGSTRWRCGHGEIGPLIHCQWESKTVQLLWKTVRRPLKRLISIELFCDPRIPLLDSFLRELKTYVHTKT